MEQRRFLVSDGVALVFATAVGCAWTRSFNDDQDFVYPSASVQGAVNAALFLGWLACPFLSTVSLAVLGLRMRRPRPRWRRIVRQPGFVACLFAGAATVLAGAGELLLSTGMLSLHPHNDREEVLAPFWLGAGGATLGAWVVMRLGVGWRAERSWVDCSGRVLGVYWIGLVVVTAMSWFLNCLG